MKNIKVISVFLIVLLLFLLVACDGKNEKSLSKNIETIDKDLDNPVQTEKEEIDSTPIVSDELVDVTKIVPEPEKIPEPKILDRNKHLFFSWESSDAFNETKQINMASGETRVVTLHVKNISDVNLQVSLSTKCNGCPKNTLEGSVIFPSKIQLEPNETKEFYIEVFCTLADEKTVRYRNIGGCSYGSEDGGITGLFSTNAHPDYWEGLPDLEVVRTDIPEYPTWTIPLSYGFYDRELDFHDNIVLLKEYMPATTGESVYFNLTAVDFKTGEKLWEWMEINIDEQDWGFDYFSLPAIYSYEIQNNTIYLHIENPDNLNYEEFPKIKENKHRYALNIKTGEIIEKSDEEILTILKVVRSDDYVETYDIKISRNENYEQSYFSLVNKRTDEALWKKEIVFPIIDFCFIGEEVFILEENKKNELDMKYYLKRYDISGNMLASREMSKAGKLFLYEDYLFYEDGQKWFNYGCSLERDRSKNDGLIGGWFISIDNISLLDTTTLDTVWTHKTDNLDKMWNKWFYIDDTIVVKSSHGSWENAYLFAINIKTGEEIWTLEDFMFGYLQYLRLEYDYYIVAMVKDEYSYYGSKHLFIDPENGEVAGIKEEKFNIQPYLDDKDRWRYRNIDGKEVIIRDCFWIDRSTYEILGINLDLYGKYNTILEIKDGYLFSIYQDKNNKQHLLCKKLTD